MFASAIIISDIAILIRAVYRVIELAQGWRGHLITTEWYFYVFDSTPMIICMLIWVIGHPGLTLEIDVIHKSEMEA
jgi:RTA1 like protein